MPRMTKRERIEDLIIKWSMAHMKIFCEHCCGGDCKDCFGGTIKKLSSRILKLFKKGGERGG